MKSLIVGFVLFFTACLGAVGCVVGVPNSGIRNDGDIVAIQFAGGVGLTILAGFSLKFLADGVEK